MRDNILIIVFFLAAAVLCPITAILLKQGKMKTAFLPFPANPAIPVDWPYSLWPVGLAGLLTLIGFITDNRVLAMVGLFGVIPLSLAFMVWKPCWLKPDWLLWLEGHYDKPTREFMFEQARQDKAWNQRISTQVGLEAWAEEMVQRYRSVRGFQ